MKALVRPTLVVTGFTMGAQLTALLAQAVIARFLGAGSETDALFAALTLPQYATNIISGAMGVVLIPVFMECRAKSGSEEAWRFATGILGTSFIVFSVIAALGVLFAEPLLRVAVPGLSDEARRMAAGLSLALWPFMVFSGVASILISLHQIEGRFTKAAVAPFIGAVVYLALLAVLVPRYGALGAATATTLNVAVQCAMLAHIVIQRSRFPLAFSHPGVVMLLGLIGPLLLSNVFIRSTIVIDRFLASDLPSGSISHLGYAFRVVSAAGVAVSAGLGAVLFPPLADAIARHDIARFRETASRSLRIAWLVVAPLMTISMALAPSAIELVFERGEFGAADSAAVGLLLRIYLLALISMSLATVTSRAIYALRATRLIALAGSIEAIAYLGYTYLLARTFGAPGIAAGFVIYYSISMLWQGVYLRQATGGTGGRRVTAALGATTALSAIAGAAAWGVTLLLGTAAGRVTAGGTTGVALYVAALAAARPRDAVDLWSLLRQTKPVSE